MVLNLLIIICFTGGFLAVLYSILALLSMLKYSRSQKVLPEKHETESGKADTAGPPVADAYIRRARILIQNEQFEAALADCKRAIDINANHTEAHTLWEHALEREIPPGLLTEAKQALIIPVIEPAPDKKKVKKVVKKIKRRKKAATKQILEEKPAETLIIPAEEVEPEKIPPTELKEEILLGEKPTAEPEVEPEVPEEAPKEIIEEVEEPEPVPDEEIPPAEKPEPEVEPEVPEEAPKEIIEEAEEPEPVPDEEIPPAEKPEPEVEPEVPEEAPKEIIEEAEEPESVPEKPPVSDEVAEEEIVEPKPPSGADLGPLIPEDQLVTPKPAGKSLLEEFDSEKLKEYEEGEAGAGDAEWTRYADKNTPELAESKINMNELPAEAAGLKETLIDLRQSEAYNLQGETNIGKNLYNNAIKDFSRALKINPNYVDALINRGSAFAQLGRFNDALIDFNHALKFEKKDAELYNKRGEVFMQNNMYDQAIKDFTAAIVLNPMYSDAYLNRGRAYSEKGMPDEASTDFNNAIKADSDHAFSFVDRAAPGIHVDDGLESDGGKAQEFNEKGLAELKNEKFKEALESFTQAINFSSSDAESYINRGRVNIKLNKPDEAMDDFNQAVLFDPLNAALYFWRALAWKEKKDMYNMKEDLKLSCEMGHEPACIAYAKLKSAKK